MGFKMYTFKAVFVLFLKALAQQSNVIQNDV